MSLYLELETFSLLPSTFTSSKLKALLLISEPLAFNLAISRGSQHGAICRDRVSLGGILFITKHALPAFLRFFPLLLALVGGNIVRSNKIFPPQPDGP